MVLFQQTTSLVLCLLTLYFLWMDVNLYSKIQSTDISVFPPEKERNSSSNESHFFSPFSGFSVKMVLLDQASNYIFNPLAEIFENVRCFTFSFSLNLFLPQLTNFSANFPSVTPNMISASGVVFACISARMILIHDVRIHRLAIFVFMVT